MKILYHNYSNFLSTEPMYMHNAFTRCGIDSVFWNSNQTSAYDMFDLNKPDVFVTHFKTFTYDILDYLKNNKSNIEIVMNVTGATQSQINSIEQAFEECKVKSPFIFTNDFTLNVKSNLKLIQLYPAADVFIADPSAFKEIGVPEAIISNKFTENLEKHIANKEVFHLLHMNGEKLDSNFDLMVNIQSLSQLYKVYPKFTLVGDNELCCSQLFLDMNLSCKKMEVRSSDPVGFQKMLKELFSETQTEDVQLEIKNQIKNKHTPFDRAWRFMKYLGDKDAMDKVTHVKNSIPSSAHPA